MKTLNKLLLTIMFGILTVEVFAACSATDSIITFKFVPDNDMFYTLYRVELNHLYDAVEQYRKEIVSGNMPIYVDAYSASGTTTTKNLKIAHTQANRVKSELITHKALKKSNFITKNYSGKYRGCKDMVIITMRVPICMGSETANNEVKNIESKNQLVSGAVTTEPEILTEVDGLVGLNNPTDNTGGLYLLAVRTNLLYDAFTVPTFGLEWRINRHASIKVDGSYSFWGNKHGNVQKIWMVNPEIRWYLLENKRFYTGIFGQASEYNVYGYPLGNQLSKDTGYQGNLWNVGLTVGYCLHLPHSFSIDFNIGLGYARFNYDSFSIIDETRVYKEKDRFKNFWGATQVGINLVWTIENNK